MKEKIIIVIMFLLNVALFYKLQDNMSVNKTLDIKDTLSVYNNSILKSYHTNGKKFSKLLRFINIEDMNSYNLNDMLGSGQKIIFVYDINDCNICVKEEIRKLNKLSNLIRNHVICILLGGDNMFSYAVTFKRINQIKFPVMIINNTDEPAMKKIIKTTPVYFLINNDGMIINSFYTTEKGEELSNVFYQYIKEYFGRIR